VQVPSNVDIGLSNTHTVDASVPPSIPVLLDDELPDVEVLECDVVFELDLLLDVDTLLEVDVLLENVPPSGTSEPGDEHAVSAR
jgi:hypothetical protein